MQIVERALAGLDWLLGWGCYLSAAVVGTMGLMMGVLSYSEKGDLGGHGFTLALAATLWVIGRLCAAAARSMRQQERWRWLIQLSPFVAWVVGFTLSLCVSGTTVLFGGAAICNG